MSLRALYQELILDHAKSPRCFGTIENASCSCDAHNPVCGDELNISANLSTVIDEIKFTGKGCAISVASASMLCQQLSGLEIDAAKKIVHDFLEMLTQEADDNSHLGKLEVFAGVRLYPLRVKCATLAWHAVQSILTKEHAATVTTE
jgi:nitrogen fixation protein NifU and related proteins